MTLGTMSTPRTSRPRTADCPDVIMLLRGQGLDDVGVSQSGRDPEHRPGYEGETVLVAVHCGPCVGVYRAPPRPRTAQVTPPEASTS
jgi:hypothetical protein